MSLIDAPESCNKEYKDIVYFDGITRSFSDNLENGFKLMDSNYVSQATSDMEEAMKILESLSTQAKKGKCGSSGN